MADEPSVVEFPEDPSPEKRSKESRAYKGGKRKDYAYGQGHRNIRGTHRLQVMNEARKMWKDGKSIAEIEASLKLSKGIAIRHLYGNRERRLLRQIIEEATIDAMLIFAEGLEVVKMEVQHMKAKSAAGELNLTPEQLGTMVRSIEKAHDLVKLTSGRAVSMFKDAVAETKNPGLNKAEERLKELEAQGVVLDD